MDRKWTKSCMQILNIRLKLQFLNAYFLSEEKQ